MNQNKFPDGFLWGAATSSHQIEGNNQNDWTKWEEAGHVKNGQLSGAAADSWNRYGEDIALLEELNLKAYRFSIEWSRIEPIEGQFDEAALHRYRDLIKQLNARGITPVVTLHHFTNPFWAADWTDRRMPARFNRYAEYVARHLGDQVNIWCTINEPEIFTGQSYWKGVWPPGKKGVRSALRAAGNIIKAHCLAYESIHSIYKSEKWFAPRVSMAFNMQYFEPASRTPWDMVASRVARYATNDFFLRRVKRHIDFIGLNFYFSNRVSVAKRSGWFRGQTEELRQSDLHWDLYPNGLYYVLRGVKKYKLPVIITENGIADAKDSLRKWYILSHLQAIHRALQEQVNIIGYMHWALIDNFEWLEGYDGRFGLVEVDFKTFKRTIRPSALTYAQIAKDNGLDNVLAEELS